MQVYMYLFELHKESVSKQKNHWFSPKSNLINLCQECQEYSVGAGKGKTGTNALMDSKPMINGTFKHLNDLCFRLNGEPKPLMDWEKTLNGCNNSLNGKLKSLNRYLKLLNG